MPAACKHALHHTATSCNTHVVHAGPAAPGAAGHALLLDRQVTKHVYQQKGMHDLHTDCRTQLNAAYSAAASDEYHHTKA